MKELNLPKYNFRLKKKGKKLFIFDRIRKKYVFLSPEEWVRQNFISYLIEEKQFPESLFSVEMPVNYKMLKNRCDIAVYNNKGDIKVLVECKAPEIKISQEAFDQIARYNMKLKVDYLIVTNGIVHYCCKLDYSDKKYLFLNDIPDYKLIR